MGGRPADRQPTPDPDRVTAGRQGRLLSFLAHHGLDALEPADAEWALTHSSFAGEHPGTEDNERLEFLGDALLAAISSEYLFEQDPQADEGELSNRRSRLVSRALLGRRAADLGLGELVRLGRGERETGGARRRSVIGSAIEALVGVVFLRLGFAAARTFTRRHIIEPLATELARDAEWVDHKTALQLWTQKRFKCVPAYRLLAEDGPDHDRTFRVSVEVEGRELARGAGRRIKSAENDAARQALEGLRDEEG